MDLFCTCQVDPYILKNLSFQRRIFCKTKSTYVEYFSEYMRLLSIFILIHYHMEFSKWHEQKIDMDTYMQQKSKRKKNL